MGDAVLLEQEVQVGVGEAALPPVFLGDDITGLRLEVGVEFATPGVPGEVVVLFLVALAGGEVVPGLVVTWLPPVVRDEHHPYAGLAGGGDHGAQVVQQTNLLRDGLHFRPGLAALGDEVVVGINKQNRRAAGVVGLSHGFSLLNLNDSAHPDSGGLTTLKAGSADQPAVSASGAA